MKKHSIRCFMVMVCFFTGLQILTIDVSNLPAGSDNKLAVVICSSTSPKNPLVIDGYFIYVKNGKEIKRKIDKSGWGWNVFGEYIKEVKVRKVSGDGSYQLYVMENSASIFESGSVSSCDPVVYKR